MAAYIHGYRAASSNVALLLDKLAPMFVTALTPAPLRPSSSA